MTPLDIVTTLLVLAIFALHNLTGSSLLKPKDEDKIETRNLSDDPLCHIGYHRPMEHLAMKTPYMPEPNEIRIPAGCSASQFWMLSRHGTRYPGTEDIEAMLERLPALRDEIVSAASQGEVCESEIEPFRQWEPPAGMNVSVENNLVDQGYKELEGIGARYAERFPDLFPPNYSNKTYYFRTSVEQRAIESSKAFAKGVFGSLDDVYFPEPLKDDPILHFYKSCKKYKAQVKQNPDASTEYEQFTQTPQFQTTQRNVQERLGLPRNLTSDEIILMYKTCGFELAWNPDSSSPWCAVFDKTDLSILEYREDLEDYWKDGYGFSITYEQACKPVEDVVERFSAMVDGNGTETTVAYFAHHGTLLKLYGRLGLFKDPKNLTAEGYEEFKESRAWKNGQIGKFASNLAFVLLHCPEESSPYHVATFVQEKPTPLPACDGQWMCPFERFVENLQPIVESCDLDEICQN